MLALTVKAEGKGSVPEPVTLKLLLVPFKKVKGLNAKILCSLFLFKGKVSKANEEDFKFNKSMFLKDVFIVSFL